MEPKDHFVSVLQWAVNVNTRCPWLLLVWPASSKYGPKCSGEKMAPKCGAAARSITVPSGVWMAILQYGCDGASLCLSSDSACRTGDNSPSDRQSAVHTHHCDTHGRSCFWCIKCTFDCNPVNDVTISLFVILLSVYFLKMPEKSPTWLSSLKVKWDLL